MYNDLYPSISILVLFHIVHINAVQLISYPRMYWRCALIKLRGMCSDRFEGFWSGVGKAHAQDNL